MVLLVSLCALPCAAGALVLLAGGLGVAEPFMIFKARDAAVFFGAPIAIVALGIIWLCLALKRRLRWVLILPVLAWFGLCTFGTIEELMMYLREPWNI